MDCTTCHLPVFVYGMTQDEPRCRCKILSAMRDLMNDFDYRPAPEVRSFGGAFALRRPDDSIVWEHEMMAEVDRCIESMFSDL